MVVTRVDGEMITVRTTDGYNRFLYNWFQLKSIYDEPSALNRYFNQTSKVIPKNSFAGVLFSKAKKDELSILCLRGTWNIIRKNDVPTDSNILDGRFVHAIKDEGTKHEV